MNKRFIIGLNQVSWERGRTVGIWRGNGEVEKQKSGKVDFFGKNHPRKKNIQYGRD